MNEPLTTIYRGPFAGRDRNFRLRLGEIEMLEVAGRAGIGEIAMRLTAGLYRLSDIRETIRLGLLGAGESEVTATALVMDHFDDKPVHQFVELAGLIIHACVAGIAPPKAEGESTGGPAISETSTGPLA